MTRHHMVATLIGMTLTWLSGCAPLSGRLVIVCPRDATSVEVLAAREVRRYVYLRTGALAQIIDDLGAVDRWNDKILVASKERDVVRQLTANYQQLPEVALLEPGHYLLKTIDENGSRMLLVTGGNTVGTLYGAYRFCEHLGVRYYLHGDVVPDEAVMLRLPELNERAAPLFNLRGIQPFHDFPEGPDFWSVDGYKAIISQLPKLRMNFIGFHAYPQGGGGGAEPMVWIGLPEDVGQDGKVRFSYPSWHFCNMHGTWGYESKVTSDYSFGSSQLFEQDVICQDVQSSTCPKPVTVEQCNELFDRFADKLRAAFAHAHSLGVKTCIGTEVPLTVPSEVIGRIDIPRSPVEPISGRRVGSASPISQTDDDALYQVQRRGVKGYRLTVPNGKYKVELMFAELAHQAAGKRVFGVKIQDNQVVDKFDIFAVSGKNQAINRIFDDVEVTDGVLKIDFVKQVDHPCIAAIVVSSMGGDNTTLKVNCGGQAYKDYLADELQPLQPTDWEQLYEGIFLRIMRSHPLDYYWFWTPENWTWQDIPESVVETTLDNIRHAIAAAKRVKAPFQLATCGWVLGPQYDRALFNKELPKDIAMSCISRAVGHDPVEPGFAQTVGRDKWAIPWLEDDPAMISPQLWVGRMRKDAVDAHQYGCNGLMGIHWRTRILGPNVSALAQAAWKQRAWLEPTTPPEDRKAGRFLASDDFYTDWALHMFGPEVANEIGQLFARIDDYLPRPSTWVKGPGGIKPDPRPFEEVGKEYAFVEDLAALRPNITGAGNLDRFDYWLNQFRYMKANARVNCIWARYNDAMAKVEAEKDTEKRKRLAREIALPVRKELVQAVSEVYRYLLATVSNTGEMGTLINWEQHILPGLLERPGEALAKKLGEPLPADAMPVSVYTGPARIFVPEIRTSVSVGEPLNLKVIVLATHLPRSGMLYWRPLGTGQYAQVPLTHIARGVWSVQVPAEATQNPSYEYYIEVLAQGGEILHFPVTAPRLNQTVVVAPADL